jgi:hypothetical protein
VGWSRAIIGWQTALGFFDNGTQAVVVSVSCSRGERRRRRRRRTRLHLFKGGMFEKAAPTGNKQLTDRKRTTRWFNLVILVNQRSCKNDTEFLYL